jgi:predicted PurR-regulated permease PerM
LGVVLIYIATALFFVFIAFLVVPILAEELSGFSSAYSILTNRLLLWLNQFGALPFSDIFADTIKELISSPASFLSDISKGAFNISTSVFGGIFSFILLVVLSFYLAAQERGIENFLRLVSPLEYEPYIIDLWERSQQKLGRWFRGQILLGAIVGVMIFLGLTILGVNYSFILALIAAIFEIIPIVGPVLAAAPAIIIALLQAPQIALLVVVLYIFVQQIESHLMVPIVMRKVVGLSPLVIVLALLVGAKLGGILGILLAVPVTAVLAEFIDDIDKKKRSIMPE